MLFRLFGKVPKDKGDDSVSSLLHATLKTNRKRLEKLETGAEIPRRMTTTRRIPNCE